MAPSAHSRTDPAGFRLCAENPTILCGVPSPGLGSGWALARALTRSSEPRSPTNGGTGIPISAPGFPTVSMLSEKTF